jgi:hypothetical protein
VAAHPIPTSYYLLCWSLRLTQNHAIEKTNFELLPNFQPNRSPHLVSSCHRCCKLQWLCLPISHHQQHNEPHLKCKSAFRWHRWYE